MAGPGWVDAWWVVDFERPKLPENLQPTASHHGQVRLTVTNPYRNIFNPDQLKRSYSHFGKGTPCPAEYLWWQQTVSAL